MAKILIVDDSLVMRKNLATILKGAGHVIIGEATNGKQAVLMYEEIKPDVVTMDISMPILNGVDAVKEIIAIDPEAKIIMVSAVNQKKMVFTAINAGAKHYIIKPIDNKKVISIVEEVLEADSVSEATMDEHKLVQGFQINNQEGTFVVLFNKHFNQGDHNLLVMAIRGLLFIQPLRVVYDFTEITSMEDELLRPIIALTKEIKNQGGSITYMCQGSTLLSRIHALEA